jgi:hypothetical protein
MEQDISHSGSATTPATEPPAADYVRRLLDVLGGRDPIEVQSSVASRLRELTDGVASERLHRPEAPEKWSVAAVVRHLADNDIVHGYRMRKIVGGLSPRIDGYDENDWARELRYLDADFDEAMSDFEAIRAMNLCMLDRLSPEQWQRTGLHNERGEESVRRVVELIAAHDLVHLAQVERILRSSA